MSFVMKRVSDHLEANLSLLIKTFQRVGSADICFISAGAGVIRVMLLVLFPLVPLRVLRHGMDLPLGGVEHDGENLQVSQQPQLAETRPFATLPH